MSIYTDYRTQNSGGKYLKIDPETGVTVRLLTTPAVIRKELREGDGAKDRFLWIVLRKNDDDEPEAVQVFESGAMVFNGICSLAKQKKWGDPKDYDLTITRKGSGMDTEYFVSPSPKSKLSNADLALLKDSNLAVEDLTENADEIVSEAEWTPVAKKAKDYDPFEEE